MPEEKKSLCDESAFNQFFEDQAKTLIAYLHYRFGNKEQAHDMAQEAFTKLWLKCTSVPFEKAKGFLYTVATNLFTSEKRHEQVKLRYTQSNQIESDKSNIESPEFLIIEKEFREKLMQAISKLPEKQRAAFLLNRVEKKTYREIAEIMNVSVKAIEKLMHKALLKIREQVTELNK
ncbi:MAG: sigma-70 family RNA polymerase sigma factor [Cyclobacteriaceae bacterium]